MKMIPVVLVCFLLITPTTVAQPLDPFERVLLPIDLMEPTRPSLYGSVWMTRIVLHNRSDRPVLVSHGMPACTVCPGTGGLIQLPGKTTRRLFKQIEIGNPGALYFLERDRRRDVAFSSRLLDLTHADSEGVDLPIVFEEDFFQGSRLIIDVPATSAARRLLRIYEVDANVGARFEVRIVHEETGVTRTAVIVVGRTAGADDPPGFPSFPAYAQLPFDGPETTGTYRVEITPESGKRSMVGFHLNHEQCDATGHACVPERLALAKTHVFVSETDVREFNSSLRRF